MKRRLIFIACVFVATILFFVVQRGVWLLYYHAQSGMFGAGDILRTFVFGLRLDASTAGYVTSVPLLAMLAGACADLGRRGGRIVRRIVMAWLVFVSLFVSWIFTADAGLYEYWQTRIDSQILVYSPAEMLASLTVGQTVAAVVCYLAMSAAMIFVYAVICRRLMPSERPRRRISSASVLLLSAALLFVVIRGGLSPATANVSKVYFSKEMFLNHAAVNPTFSFMSTLFGGDEYDRYRFFGEEQAERLFSEAMRAGAAADAARLTDADSLAADAGGWLVTPRPHVVVVIMEGFGRTITDAVCDGEPVAPNLARLAGESIRFENLYASSFRTDRGTVALLSGFPAQPQMSIMKDVRKASALPSIARTLAAEAGYATRFFYGGDANFTNTRAYLFSTGFDEVADQSSMPQLGTRSKWGYADDAVMEYVVDRIVGSASDGQPRLDVWLTLSSHEPFEVPCRRLSDERLNAFAFTDDVIGRMVERLRASRAWDDLLLILVPDHGYQYPSDIAYNSPERHHIPMLWLGGAVRRPLVVGDYASQTDLAATLLGQMSLSHDDFPFSRDLSRGGASRFGYWTFNDGFGIIDSSGATVYDCTSDTIVGSRGSSDSLRLVRGKALLQKTFERIRAL